MMKMTILYLKDCGHAMAALTRVATPTGDVKPSTDHEVAVPEVVALAGDLLPVRGFPAQASTSLNLTKFAIPARHLNLLTLDRNDDQLLSPHAYLVRENTRLDLPSVPPPPPMLKGADKGTLYVTLPAAVTKDRHIMLHLVPVGATTGDDQFGYSVYKSGTSTASEVAFSMGGPLSGSYDVLVLLMDCSPLVFRLNVP
jgi:hypothetical protein